MAQSPNFIDNGTVSSTGAALPGTKVNGPTPQPFPANEQLTAPETNTVTGALADIKSVVTRAVSIMSYGADPTGATDSSSALAAACAALSGGGILHLPVGTYRLSASKTVPVGVTLSFDSSLISIDNGVTLTLAGQLDAPSTQIFSFNSSYSAPPVAFTFTAGSRIPTGSIDVRWFGATGNGSTDDTVAMQAAALALISLNNAVLQVVESFPFPLAEYLIPAGAYLLSGTVCIDNYAARGVGMPTLIGATNTFPLLRIGTYSKVRGIAFSGGLHAIALFGKPPFSNGVLGALDFGTVPILIEDVFFYRQAGPAIWQDCYPATPLQSGSNGQTFPLSAVTLHVLSTADFSSSGNLTVYDNANVAHAVTYTGKTSNTFTGCACADTTAATLATGGAVGDPNHLRGTQAAIRILNFHIQGASLFWGGTDSLFIGNGHVNLDYTLTPVDTTGFPLGLINSSGEFSIHDVTIFYAAGSVPARACLVVSSGVGARRILTGQAGGVCFLRTRTHAALYQGAGNVAVPIALSNPTTPAVISIENCDLGICETVPWLEIYETFPSQITFADEEVSTPFDFATALGIWIDQAVSLDTPLTTTVLNQVIDLPGVDGNHKFTLTQGWEPGSSTAPALTGGVDVTAQLMGYRKQQPNGENLSLQNLATYQSADFQNPPSITSGGTTSDTTTPYTVHGATAAATPFAGTVTFDATHFIPNTLPAGTYTFSYYFKSNFAGLFSVITSTTLNAGNAFRRFSASDQWQRIEIPFYYPGNSENFLCQVNFLAPAKYVAWAAGTYAAGAQATKSGNLYLCAVGGSSTSGPSGTGQTTDGAVLWNYVGPAPSASFTPTIFVGFHMVNKGDRAAPYVFPGNADSAGRFGWAPAIYYGTAAPTAGNYVVGDQCVNTAPGAGGIIGWVCTTAGSPGTWKAFGQIQT